MTETSSVPRRGVETDPVRALAGQLAAIRKELARLGKTASLRNSSISDSTGTVRLRFSTDEGALIAYAEDGGEVARFGLLAHSVPGEYGIETLSGGEWTRAGDASVVEELEATVASLQEEAADRDILIQELTSRVDALEGI